MNSAVTATTFSGYPKTRLRCGTRIIVGRGGRASPIPLRFAFGGARFTRPTLLLHLKPEEPNVLRLPSFIGLSRPLSFYTITNTTVSKSQPPNTRSRHASVGCLQSRAGSRTMEPCGIPRRGSLLLRLCHRCDLSTDALQNQHFCKKMHRSELPMAGE